MSAERLRTRQRVRHSGMLPDEPDARVWRITAHGVWVTLSDGRRVCWHPDDVSPAERTRRTEGVTTHVTPQ